MSKPKTAAEAMDMIFKRKIKKGTLKPDSTVSVQFTAAKKDCNCGSAGSTDATKLSGTIKHEQ